MNEILRELLAVPGRRIEVTYDPNMELFFAKLADEDTVGCGSTAAGAIEDMLLSLEGE